LSFAEEVRKIHSWPWSPNRHQTALFRKQSHGSPRCVGISDTDLTLNEKRAILASWASDACALEASPHLRCASRGKQPVPFDDVMEALQTLDKEANAKDSAHYRRLLRRGRLAQTIVLDLCERFFMA